MVNAVVRELVNYPNEGLWEAIDANGNRLGLFYNEAQALEAVEKADPEESSDPA